VSVGGWVGVVSGVFVSCVRVIVDLRYVSLQRR